MCALQNICKGCFTHCNGLRCSIMTTGFCPDPSQLISLTPQRCLSAIAPLGLRLVDSPVWLSHLIGEHRTSLHALQSSKHRAQTPHLNLSIPNKILPHHG